MPAKQKVTVKRTTKIKTNKNATKTRTKKGGSGNHKRCPACGRFM